MNADDFDNAFQAVHKLVAVMLLVFVVHFAWQAEIVQCSLNNSHDQFVLPDGDHQIQVV